MRGLSIVVLGCALAACTKSGPANDMAVSGPPYSCPPLTSYCDHALPWAPCAATLGDASSTYCLPDGGVRGGGPRAFVAVCGALRALSIANVDFSEVFYYDSASGMLVAVVTESANFGGSTACAGGPATFTPPPCQPLVPFCN